MSAQEPDFPGSPAEATPLGSLLAPIVDRLGRNTSLSPLRYDLNAGVPDRGSLPAEALARAAVRVLTDDPAGALTYGGQQGHLPLRSWIADRAARASGLAVDPAQVALTSGSAHGLENVSLAFLADGDTVLVGAPTYPGAIRTFRARGATISEVAQDKGGLDPDALRDQLTRLERSGTRPKLLYVIPNYDNPTGATLSAERRLELVEIARASGLLLVEDTAYDGLDFAGPPPPSLFAIAGGRGVIQLGTFSKTVASGLRVAWTLSERPIIDALVHMRFDNGASPFLHRLVLDFLESGEYEPHVARLQALYRERRDAAAGALTRHAQPYLRFELPDGGFFLWLNLVPPLSAEVVRLAASDRDVALTPGRGYYAGSGGEGQLRLVYSALPPRDLAEAIARFGETLSAVAQAADS